MSKASQLLVGLVIVEACHVEDYTSIYFVNKSVLNIYNDHKIYNNTDDEIKLCEINDVSESKESILIYLKPNGIISMDQKL